MQPKKDKKTNSRPYRAVWTVFVNCAHWRGSTLAIYKTVKIIFPLNLQTITITLDVVKWRWGEGELHAPAHISAVAMAAIGECDFELLSQPPYSPGLAPSDYHVFRSLKDSLRGQRFGCEEEVINTINDWFELQEKQFFVDGVNSLTHRWEKCVVLEGDYIEKL